MNPTAFHKSNQAANAPPRRRGAVQVLHYLRVLAGLTLLTTSLQSADLTLTWQSLPPLPDPIGFAGAYAGTSGGALIVAGGANFPEKMPWKGGRKVWYDSVFVLERTNGQWQTGLRLPRPLGYGVSITTPDGVLCIGGGDAKEHIRDVFLLRWRRGKLTCVSFPALPGPVANSCGALVGDVVYVAGGTATPDATNALKNFWTLDLNKPKAAWQELTSWPGPPRMLSAAAAVDGRFYLIGGADLRPDTNGQPVRTSLKDAYRFDPGKGWTRVADMSNPVVAAPTPAPTIGKNTFLTISGGDGTLANFEPKSRHPGFPNRVLAYDTTKDTWRAVGETPAPRVTLPTAKWNGRYILPSGEARPGVRSPEVWAIVLKPSR